MLVCAPIMVAKGSISCALRFQESCWRRSKKPACFAGVWSLAGSCPRPAWICCLMPMSGTILLVHVGFAISRIDEEEAKTTLAYLEELGELQAELGAPEKEVAHEAPG